MIVLTGVIGLSGGRIIRSLAAERFKDLVLINGGPDGCNRAGMSFPADVSVRQTDDQEAWIRANYRLIQLVICFFGVLPGAEDLRLFGRLFAACAEEGLPLIYVADVVSLDRWVLSQSHRPYFWARICPPAMSEPSCPGGGGETMTAGRGIVSDGCEAASDELWSARFIDIMSSRSKSGFYASDGTYTAPDSLIFRQ